MSAKIFPLTVPKWGIEMQEGTLSAWHAEEGDDVQRGQELVDIETDKIVNALEAPASGTLRRRLAQPGDTLPVGALIGVLAEAAVEDADVEAFVRDFVPADASFEEPATEPAPSAQAEPAEARPSSIGEGGPPGKVRISPVARRLAERLGVDVTKIKGSGRHGRISKGDVEAAAATSTAPGAAASEPPEYTAERMGSLRRSIARRLVTSKQSIPHFYLTVDISMDSLLARRARLNENRTADNRVSINDMIVRAAALALREVPEVNAQLHGDEIRRFAHVDMGVAVATEDGLIAPVVRAAETMTLDQLGSALRGLAQRARDRSLEAQDLEGGTFTVSNLGMHGVKQFDAVINPPQCAVLAVGAVEARCVVRDGAVEVGRMLTVTLSCDHRVVDGELGARYLRALTRQIESPDEV